MTYEYHCQKCDASTDVIKPVKDIDVKEFCGRCQSDLERKFIPSRIHFTGTSVQHAEYNPGLGAVTKNRDHRAELAKRKGLVEVGNDFKSGESMQTQFDRARQEKLNQRYEDI